jgi:hypothetical protein
MLFRAVTDGDPTVCMTLLAPAAAASSSPPPTARTGVEQVLPSRVVDPRRYEAPDCGLAGILHRHHPRRAAAGPARSGPGARPGRLHSDLSRVCRPTAESRPAGSWPSVEQVGQGVLDAVLP